MPSYAGFYVSPTAWTQWLHTQETGRQRYGPAMAEEMIDDVLREKNIRTMFRVGMVPIPQSEPYERNWGLMIYRRKDKRHRVYLPPRDAPISDLDGKRLLEERLGLSISDWKTIWYDEDAPDPGCEFLLPPGKENGS